MFKSRLKYTFIAIAIIALLQLFINMYLSYQFKNNPLSESLQNRINEKEKELQYLAFKYYKIKTKIPLFITGKMNDKLFGLTSLEKNGNLKIYLNKNRMQENIDYMIDDVFAHEYAHAVMFLRKLYTKKDDGHSLEWQKTCLNLGGQKCNRFVKHQDIVFEKMKF